MVGSEAGDRVRLPWHVAKANPQADTLTDGEALVNFQGPHAYDRPEPQPGRACKRRAHAGRPIVTPKPIWRRGTTPERASGSA
jgi:hypothetical protein